MYITWQSKLVTLLYVHTEDHCSYKKTCYTDNGWSIAMSPELKGYGV